MVPVKRWDGSSEVFAVGHDFNVLSVFDTVPFLGASKVRSWLRMSLVGLESGLLRYVDQNAQFADNPAEGSFSLTDGVLASGAVPAVFQPVQLLAGNYVDGGIRDLLPTKAAINAGANLIINVVAGQPVTPAAPSFANANLLAIAAGALTDIMPNQVLQDHLNPPVLWPVPVQSAQVTDIPGA